jgi:maleylpyruvate isomerase
MSWSRTSSPLGTGGGERVGLVLALTDRAAQLLVGSGAGPSVTGSVADIARWLTGRDVDRLASSSGLLPDIPRWF